MIAITRKQIRKLVEKRLSESIKTHEDNYDQGFKDAMDGITPQLDDDSYIRGYDEGSSAGEGLAWKEEEYADTYGEDDPSHPNYKGNPWDRSTPGIVESTIDLGIAVVDASEYPAVTTSTDGRMMDYGSNKSDSHEGRMTKAKLFRMGRMSQSLGDRLEDGDDLPEWVQDKITTAEDRLGSAFKYIDYKLHKLKLGGSSLTESKFRNIVKSTLLL